MGAGIAHVCAFAGLDVLLYDNQAAQLSRAVATIKKNLSRQSVATADSEAVLRRIKLQETPGEWLATSDFIIEAVSENKSIKFDVYEKVNAYIADDAVFASNTSSYPIGELAEKTPNPENFIGMHFMNPVPLMARTSEELTLNSCCLEEGTE